AQVVNEHFEEGFTFAVGVGASAQTAAQAPLDAGMDAFTLPTLPVYAVRETALELAPVAGLWPLATTGAGVERDDGAADAQALTCQTVVVFGVVGRISQQPIHLAQMPRRLPQHRAKLGRVLTGADGQQGSGHQMRVRLGSQGELGVVFPVVPF